MSSLLYMDEFLETPALFIKNFIKSILLLLEQLSPLPRESCVLDFGIAVRN